MLRVEPDMLDQLLHPTLDPADAEASSWPRAAGLAGGGLGGHRVHPDEAEKRAKEGAASSWSARDHPRTSTAWSRPRGS